MRATAEHDTTEGLCRGNVRVVVGAEECAASCACANSRHNIALLSEDDFFDITFISGLVAYVVVSVVAVVFEEFRV